jgi:hypothetical protein
MNDMSKNNRDTLSPKGLMFEAAFEIVKKLNMSLISNVTDLENDMPVAIVTLQGVNMGTVQKQTTKTDKSLTVTYSLNEATLYTVTYPINENGGTGKSVVQNFLPEDAVTYMGW